MLKSTNAEGRGGGKIVHPFNGESGAAQVLPS